MACEDAMVAACRFRRSLGPLGLRHAHHARSRPRPPHSVRLRPRPPYTIAARPTVHVCRPHSAVRALAAQSVCGPHSALRALAAPSTFAAPPSVHDCGSARRTPSVCGSVRACRPHSALRALAAQSVCGSARRPRLPPAHRPFAAPFTIAARPTVHVCRPLRLAPPRCVRRPPFGLAPRPPFVFAPRPRPAVQACRPYAFAPRPSSVFAPPSLRRGLRTASRR